MQINSLHTTIQNEAIISITSPFPLHRRLHQPSRPPRSLCKRSSHHRRPSQRRGRRPRHDRCRGPRHHRPGGQSHPLLHPQKNKKQLTPQKPGSDLESVVYPASINNVQDYANSEHQGTLALTQLIQTYLAACPSAKIALLGYSQGAEVVGDVLCGTSSDISPKTAPLATQYGNAVVAAISMGSPAHVANQPYNKGDRKSVV